MRGTYNWGVLIIPRVRYAIGNCTCTTWFASDEIGSDGKEAGDIACLPSNVITFSFILWVLISCQPALRTGSQELYPKVMNQAT
jgi:hypothetical protein